MYDVVILLDSVLLFRSYPYGYWKGEEIIVKSF